MQTQVYRKKRRQTRPDRKQMMDDGSDSDDDWRRKKAPVWEGVKWPSIETFYDKLDRSARLRKKYRQKMLEYGECKNISVKDIELSPDWYMIPTYYRKDARRSKKSRCQLIAIMEATDLMADFRTMWRQGWRPSDYAEHQWIHVQDKHNKKLYLL